jgi:hypothetical protein
MTPSADPSAVRVSPGPGAKEGPPPCCAGLPPPWGPGPWRPRRPRPRRRRRPRLLPPPPPPPPGPPRQFWFPPGGPPPGLETPVAGAPWGAPPDPPAEGGPEDGEDDEEEPAEPPAAGGVGAGPLPPLGASDIMERPWRHGRPAAPLGGDVPSKGPCRRGLELRRVRRPDDGRARMNRGPASASANRAGPARGTKAKGVGRTVPRCAIRGTSGATPRGSSRPVGRGLHGLRSRVAVTPLCARLAQGPPGPKPAARHHVSLEERDRL